MDTILGTGQEAKTHTTEMIISEAEHRGILKLLLKPISEFSRESSVNSVSHFN